TGVVIVARSPGERLDGVTQPPVGVVIVLPCLDAAAFELGLNELVVLGAEDALQDVATFVAAGLQEPRELTLRQHDGLDELLTAEPDAVADLLVGLARPRGQRIAVEP